MVYCSVLRCGTVCNSIRAKEAEKDALLASTYTAVTVIELIRESVNE